MPNYFVESYDNFHFGDPEGGEWTKHGEFDSEKAAIDCAQKVIDDWCLEFVKPGMTAEEIRQLYQSFGYVPCIRNDCGLEFAPYEYLKLRIAVITAGEL